MTKSWITVLIVTFIAIIAWVASSIAQAQPEIPITPKLQEALEPLSPEFNKTTLEKINNLNEVNSENISLEPVIPITNPIQSTTSSQIERTTNR